MNEIWLELGNGSLLLGVAMFFIGCLICLIAVVSLVVAIVLAVCYIKYNHLKNSAGLTGADAARKVLDANGLEHIKVKVTGSLIFGNSYSHYFKKVRLRRLTRNKTSLTSLAMGVQKASLAILDKEGDPDMKRRVALVPLLTFGPLAFIPLLLVGVVLDLLVFNMIGWLSVLFVGVGFLFYLLAFVLSITTLRTEKKAQDRACAIMQEQGLATPTEIDQIRQLFRLYNIQYINDSVLSFLEMIYRVLQFISRFAGKGYNISGK